jgi:LacI family transcriptional regulator
MDSRERITITDIARAAGVSTATVDRVINGRQGVKDRTRRRVREAAERLGYLDAAPSAGAADGRVRRFDFVLPAGTNTFMGELAAALAAGDPDAPRLDLHVHRIEGFRPAILANELLAIGRGSDGVGVVAIDHPLVREAIRELAGGGVPVVTLVSDIASPDRAAYIGIDNRAAGRLAGYLMGRFLGPGEAEVGLLAGSLHYRGHQEREMGFRHVLAEDFPDLTVVAIREDQDDTEHAFRETAALLRDYPTLRGVYNAGAGNRGVARALEESGREVVAIAHELTPHTRRFLIAGLLDAVIDQNPAAEALAAIRALGVAAAGEIRTPRPLPFTAFFRENLPQD